MSIIVKHQRQHKRGEGGGTFTGNTRFQRAQLKIVVFSQFSTQNGKMP